VKCHEARDAWRARGITFGHKNRPTRVMHKLEVILRAPLRRLWALQLDRTNSGKIVVGKGSELHGALGGQGSKGRTKGKV
jgi:hypothetical protein